MQINIRKRLNDERGASLLVALISLILISLLGAGIIFVTRTETGTSANYTELAQARYAAEAGVQSSINWLSNSYNAPTDFSSYGTTSVPVTYNGNPVILSALNGTSSNYPDSSVSSAYNTALSNQALSGLSSASYSTYATLLAMTPGSGVSWLGSGSGVPQTWQITSQGTMAGIRSATVQVKATYERTGTPIFAYGITGLGNTCPTVNFSGGTTDSWDSSAGTYAATQQNSGGDIGSNGNVTLTGGSTRINGTISDAINTNIGSCPANGITNSVGGTPWNGLQTLSSPITATTPPAPSPMTPTTNLNVNSNTCWGASPAGCTVISGPAVRISPNTAATGYGDITSNSNVHLAAGTYYMNSLSLNGGSVTLDSYPVVIILGGNGVSSGGTLFTSNSSTTINDGGVPAHLQIVSAAGAGLSNPPVITMNSSSSMYALVYAPNAYIHITGSSSFLGAVIGKKVTSDSSGGFHYDRSLNSSLVTLNSWQLVGFSWSKF